MSTGTDSETKLAVEVGNSNRFMPVIDFKNEWLNRDKELYTLIFTKTGVGVALNVCNVVLGSDTVEKASGRSLGLVVDGAFEMGLVSFNRVIIGSGKPDMAGVFVYDMTLGMFGAMFDAIFNARLLKLPVPPVIPVAQIDNMVVNPLFNNVLQFVPVVAVEQTNPNLQMIQKVVNGLNILTLMGGSIGLTAGLIATQVVQATHS